MLGDGVGWGGWANNVDVWWRSCCWGWGGVGGPTMLMCGNAVGFKPTHWADDMTWLR